MGIGGSFLAVKGLEREAEHDLHLVLELSRCALKGQWPAALHPPPPHPQTKDEKVIKHTFCRQDYSKRLVYTSVEISH